MFDLLGVKGPQAARYVRCESPQLNCGIAFETAELEYWRGEGNTWCSGEMRRYQVEHRRRRRFTGQILTLMTKARVAKGIRYPCSPSRKRCALDVGGFTPIRV